MQSFTVLLACKSVHFIWSADFDNLFDFDKLSAFVNLFDFDKLWFWHFDFLMLITINILIHVIYIWLFYFQSGQTFLMLACELGEINIVRELLEASVDPNAVDNVSCSE